MTNTPTTQNIWLPLGYMCLAAFLLSAPLYAYKTNSYLLFPRLVHQDYLNKIARRSRNPNGKRRQPRPT